MSPPTQVRAMRSLLWLAAAACALRLEVFGPCFAAQAPPRPGSRLGRGSAARRSHAHGRPIADMSTEFFRNAVASIEDVKVLADVSVAPDGKATLGGIPVYGRPRTGAALHKGTGPAGEPAALRAHPAQGVLELAALSGNEAALDGVELITHRRALRQLLRWAVRDPEFEGQEWQKQFRAGERKDMDLVAEWVELPGGRGRCLALTCATDSAREEEEEKGALPYGGHGSVLQHRGNLIRTLLEITGLRPWVSHSAPRHDRPEEAAGFRADFGRVATGGGASGIAHRRLLSYSLGGVKVLLEADADAVTPDGQAVKLEVMRRDRYESDFESERMVDLYFQMIFGSAEVLALGLVDFERPANPLLRAAARLEEVREFTLDELEVRTLDSVPVNSILGRMAAIIKELTMLCQKSQSSGPFDIVIQDGIMEVDLPPPGKEAYATADTLVED